jgi:hypothetical protein
VAFGAYFSAQNYGNSAAIYLGFGGTGYGPAGSATGFWLGMQSLSGSNLPLRAVRLYGAFRPGVIKTTTVLSAFPILFGKCPRLTNFANIWANSNDPSPTNPHLVPPYGNSFIFT